LERHLFIVARQRPDVHALLAREFAHDRDVDVILDRRVRDRRQPGGPASLERRRAERRSSQERESLQAYGFGLVRAAAQSA
jgi:hypothetical protein